MPLSLPQFLPAEIFAFMAVFIRMGAAFVVLPGFGEAVVPARMRLMMALAITLVVVPIVRTTLPPMPSTANIDKGRELFNTQCVFCHGVAAVSSCAPNSISPPACGSGGLVMMLTTPPRASLP